MRIVIDGFGGDNAPDEILKGTVMARQQLGGEYIITGSPELIRQSAERCCLDLAGITIQPASQIVDMHDDAKCVLKEKSDSSLSVALRMLADGQADALVSAGPTGAILMGATLIVKRIKGVRRPALAPVMPGLKGPFMLIDCGANVECRPDMLVQFALLGSIYMKKMFGIDKPSVGLANNGAEDTKGLDLQIETYRLLAADERVNFTGNAEGRDIPMGDFDVVVTDGFTGNMILKVSEGLGLSLLRQLKGMLTRNWRTKIAALLLRSELGEFRDHNDHEKVGGAPFIGVRKPVIKAHGSAKEKAFFNAIRQAIQWSSSGVSEEIEKAFAQYE